MKINSIPIEWYKPLILLLIISHLIGCSEWSVLKKPVAQSIIEDKPEYIQIELMNGERYLLKKAYVEEDQIIGGIVRDVRVPPVDTLIVGLSQVNRAFVEHYTVYNTFLYICAIVIFAYLLSNLPYVGKTQKEKN